MKKINKILLGLIATVSSLGMIGNGKENEIYAEEYSSSAVIDFWNESYQTVLNSYISKNYASKEDKKFIGKYYRVGVMGHHQVVEYGDFRLVAQVVDNTLSDDVLIGTYKNVKKESYTMHSVTNTTTLSAQVKIGTAEIANASLKYCDGANEAGVGISQSKTVESTLKCEKVYSVTNLSSETVTVEYNMENICDGTCDGNALKTYNISKVALFLECNISKSYTEEQKINGKWQKLKDTEIDDYYAHYYISTIETFTYNGGAYFGNKKTGLYKTGVIKEY